MWMDAFRARENVSKERKGHLKTVRTPGIVERVHVSIQTNSKFQCCVKHIDSSVDRGYAISKLLKRLAGVTWGSTQDVMCTAYKCYVRLVVEYGNEVLKTASDSVRTQHVSFNHWWRPNQHLWQQWHSRQI
ncbi:hypothetical protein TNCV_1904991 [Trichonephila clavipes]|nr:hypothetical protein TNCV_1904991 [Trichonephila clavipes]